MNFLESVVFLIVYVGVGAGIPLMWYARQVNKQNAHTE